MSRNLLTIIKCSLVMAIIALASLGTIYVLDVFTDAALQQALGKVLALLGIYTASALALTLLFNMGKPPAKA